MNTKKQPLIVYLILSFFILAATTALQSHRGWQNDRPADDIEAPEPTPMMGRFAVPELPENPTQVEVGENLYFYHCMPCHGDYGQGLTDEFREAWVDDHQNCWARGCHAGRPMDEGFPIPKYVPPVIASQLLIHYPEDQKLFDFLRNEHPPQNPGILDENEYWALTAYLWFENGQIPSGVELVLVKVDLSSSTSDPQSELDSEPGVTAQTESQPEPSSRLNLTLVGILVIGLGLLIVLILLIRRMKKRSQPPPVD